MIFKTSLLHTPMLDGIPTPTSPDPSGTVSVPIPCRLDSLVIIYNFPCHQLYFQVSEGASAKKGAANLGAIEKE